MCLISTHRDLPQLGLDILFLEGRDTDVLNVLLVGQQRSLQDVLQAEPGPLEVKGEPGDGLDLLPVPILHGLVAHQLQQRADVVEVVDGLLEGVEGGPLLEGLGKLPASVLELQKLVVDVLDVDLGPRDVVVVVDAVDDVIVELVQTLEQVKLLLDLVQLRLFGVRKPKEVFADGVGRVLPPEGVEVVLEHLEPVRGLSGCQSGLHGAVIVILVDKGAAVLLEDVQVGDQLLLEVLLNCEEQDLDVHGLAL